MTALLRQLLLMALTATACSANAEKFLRTEQYLPILRWHAKYPPVTAQSNLDGFCTLEFDVTINGYVENKRVLACSPGGNFEEPAKDALSKFRYQPFGYRVTGVIEIFWFAVKVDSEQSHLKHLGIYNKVVCDESTRECCAHLAP